MSVEQLKQLVDEKGPIKATELAVVVSDAIRNGVYRGDYLNDMRIAIECGAIIEVEYILPQMNYRVKSMLFPKGTEITIRK